MEKRLELRLIPEITDEQCIEMLYSMWPVHRIGGEGQYRVIAPNGIHLRKMAYTWVERPEAREVNLTERNKLGTILTMHTCAYYGFFKPTLAEVLAFIRRDVVDWQRVKYFYLDPCEVMGDKAGSSMVNSGVHVAVCTMWAEEV